MGLLHSGDLMDLIYWFLVERWATCNLAKQRFGVHWYFRFRDDVLVIADANHFQTCSHSVLTLHIDPIDDQNNL